LLLHRQNAANKLLLFTGVQYEFNFTSPPSVLGEDMSAPYLPIEEGWKIPAPLDLPQMSSVEEDKSVGNDNTQSTPTNEFFVDGTWGLSVTHEEIMSSDNQEGLNLNGFVVNEESDNIKTSVNTYELEHTVKCMDFGSFESASKASLGAFNKTRTVENTDVRIGSLESLLGPNFDVRQVDNGIFSVHTNQQQAESNVSLKNLLSGSIYHSNTNAGDEIRGADETRGRVTNVMNTIILAKSQGDSPLKAGTHLLSQTMANDEVTTGDIHVLGPHLAAQEENVAKRNQTLDLATLSGSDEVISTPAVLESLLKQDEPFDLVSYILNEVSYRTSVRVRGNADKSSAL
jgi:hypothetical protein